MSCRVTARQDIMKITEQSPVPPRTQSWTLHGVHGAPCDWGIIKHIIIAQIMVSIIISMVCYQPRQCISHAGALYT